MLKTHYPLSTNSEHTVMSPTIYRERGFVFYFFSFDTASGEPPHVHVGKGSQRSDDAKFWLDPVSVAASGRFSRRDIQQMQRVVQEQQASFLEEWNEYKNRL